MLGGCSRTSTRRNKSVAVGGFDGFFKRPTGSLWLPVACGVIPVYLRYSQLFSSTCDFSDRNRIGPRLHSVPVAEKITLSTSYVPNCCSRTSTRGKMSVNARGLEGDIVRTPMSLAFCARPLLLKGYPYFPDSQLLLFLFVGFLCW